MCILEDDEDEIFVGAYIRSNAFFEKIFHKLVKLNRIWTYSIETCAI